MTYMVWFVVMYSSKRIPDHTQKKTMIEDRIVSWKFRWTRRRGVKLEKCPVLNLILPHYNVPFNVLPCASICARHVHYVFTTFILRPVGLHHAPTKAYHVPLCLSIPYAPITLRRRPWGPHCVLTISIKFILGFTYVVATPMPSLLCPN